MKASESRHSHRKLKKQSKELNSSERTEEAKEFACGVQDLEESSMDLKGELWFIHYLGKGPQILLRLEPRHVQFHTWAEIREGNLFSKDDNISRNVFKYSGYEEIIKSDKTPCTLQNLFPYSFLSPLGLWNLTRFTKTT